MEKAATFTSNAWQALTQGHRALGWKDRVAAGVLSIALIALTVGVVMATGRSGTKALSSLAASPLLYLGIANGYQKLTQESRGELIELQNVVENKGSEVEELAAKVDPDTLALALAGHHILNPQTEIDHQLNGIAAAVDQEDSSTQKPLGRAPLHLKRTHDTGVETGRSHEAISQDISKAAQTPFIPGFHTFNMSNAEGRYQQHLWVITTWAEKDRSPLLPRDTLS